MKNPRAAIIGLDGVPIHLLTELGEKGIMSHMEALIQQGTLTKMNSSLPPSSVASWSSMITGTNPGTHGAYTGSPTVCLVPTHKAFTAAVNSRRHRSGEKQRIRPSSLTS